MAAGITSATSALSVLKTGLGAFLVGTFISTFATGMIVQQMIRYYRLYPNDPLYMKIWVFVAVVMQLLSTVLEMHVCYTEQITHYLDPAVFLKKTVWSATVITTLTPVTYVVCECFFARRVYMLGHRYRLIAIAAVILIVSSLGFAIPLTVTAATSSGAEAQKDSGGWQRTTGSAVLVAGDVTLTSVLTAYLHRSRTGVRRTDSMVDFLIRYIVSSGLLICALHTVSLVLSIADPGSALFVPSTLVVQTAYVSSFIVALNTRQLARTVGDLDDTDIGGRIDYAGEKGAAPRADHPMTSIEFAAGNTQTQASALMSRGEASSASSDTKLEVDPKEELLADAYRRGTLGTATV